MTIFWLVLMNIHIGILMLMLTIKSSLYLQVTTGYYGFIAGYVVLLGLISQTKALQAVVSIKYFDNVVNIFSISAKESSS